MSGHENRDNLQRLDREVEALQHEVAELTEIVLEDRTYLRTSEVRVTPITD